VSDKDKTRKSSDPDGVSDAETIESSATSDIVSDGAETQADFSDSAETAEKEPQAGESIPRNTETTSGDPVLGDDTDPRADDTLDDFDDSIAADEPTDYDTLHEDVQSPDESAILPPVAQQIVRETTIERRAGFFPTLIGGVLAAVIGFAMARYVVPEGWPFPGVPQQEDPFRANTQAALAELNARIDERAAATTAVQDSVAAIDLVPLDQGIADLRDALDVAQAGVVANSDDLTALAERTIVLTDELETLAKRPIADSVSRESIAAYETELERLRASMAEQRAVIEQSIEVEKQNMQRIAAEATQMEERADAANRLAAARSAMTRVRASLETGTPYAAVLADLASHADQPIGDALRASADTGVTTFATLRDDFPDAARAALAAARSTGTDGGDEAGLGGFLREQFQSRSITPQEGDSANAILSRAQVAVDAGDLGAALTELQALPDAAKAETQGWINAATTRDAAIAEADALAQSLNQEQG